MQTHVARVQTRTRADWTEAACLNREDDRLEDGRVFVIKRTIDEDVPGVLVSALPRQTRRGFFARHELPRLPRGFVLPLTYSSPSERECRAHRGSTRADPLSQSCCGLPSCL